MSTNTPLPNDPEAAHEEYQRLRPVLTRLHSDILRLLRKEDSLACAKRLGMLKKQEGKKVVRFGHPLEIPVFNDYQMYMYRSQGVNAVQIRYNSNRYPKGSDEQQLLAAMTRARFSVFAVSSVLPDIGITCLDVYSGESFFVMDRSLAQQQYTGLMTGLRIFPFRDCWMHTGINIALGSGAKIEEIIPLGALQTVKEEQELNESVIIKWREMLVGAAAGNYRPEEEPPPEPGSQLLP